MCVVVDRLAGKVPDTEGEGVTALVDGPDADVNSVCDALACHLGGLVVTTHQGPHQTDHHFCGVETYGSLHALRSADDQ